MSIRRPFGCYTSALLSVLFAAQIAVPALATSKPTYAHKMEIGQLLYFNGDVERAINAFKAAAELNPKSFEPHLSLLNLYIQKGGDAALESASTECAEVLKRKPNNKEVHLILGHILRTQAGNETEPEKQKAKLAEARKEVEMAEEMGAPAAMCENTLGLIDLQTGDSDSALKHIEAAIHKQPVFPDAHLIRAVLLFKGASKVEAHGQDTTITVKNLNAPEMKDKIDEILHELDLAIKQKDKNPEAYNTKADITFAMGKHEEALELYKKATEQEPRYAQAWTGIANAEAQIATKASDSTDRDKHYKAAKEAFEKAIKYKPGDKNSIYGLAIMLEKMGQTSEAISEFQNGLMVETDPMMRAQISLHIQQLQQMASLGGLSKIDTTMHTEEVSAKLLNAAGGNTGSASANPLGGFTNSSFNQNYANLIKIKAPAGKEKKEDE